jgi:hypothetical protein
VAQQLLIGVVVVVAVPRGVYTRALLVIKILLVVLQEAQVTSPETSHALHQQKAAAVVQWAYTETAHE